MANHQLPGVLGEEIVVRGQAPDRLAAAGGLGGLESLGDLEHRGSSCQVSGPDGPQEGVGAEGEGCDLDHWAGGPRCRDGLAGMDQQRSTQAGRTGACGQGPGESSRWPARGTGFRRGRRLDRDHRRRILILGRKGSRWTADDHTRGIRSGQPDGVATSRGQIGMGRRLVTEAHEDAIVLFIDIDRGGLVHSSQPTGDL